MAWTNKDIKKYIDKEIKFIMLPRGYGKAFKEKQIRERNKMSIKYITINYIDTKYEIQIKREK